MRKVVPNNAVLIPDQAQQVFSGVIFDTFQWQQELFDGSTTTFEMLKRTDTVSTICIVHDQIVILDEKQPPNISRRSFPGGRIDPTDSDVLSAAKREVLEETGYTFEDWKLVKVVQPSSEIEWFVYVFIASGSAQKSEPTLDPGEKIELNLCSLEQTKQLISQDEHLAHNQDVFQGVTSISQLLNLSEYSGNLIDR